MKHGSLFSGIGGFDLAAEWMGWENVFHCEINEFGRKVLNYYWPKAKSYEDITKTDFFIHRGKIDILTGGFPCQPYSAAGKRLGKEDDRHLWPEMLRAIREISPRWVVGENVRGLISWSGGLVFDEVQADLETEGYQVAPFLLPASGVGAPHQRERIWFVAYSNCTGLEKKGAEQPTTRVKQYRKLDRLAPNATSIRQPGKEHREAQSRRIAKKSISDDWQNFPAQSPICSGDDGFPPELDGITFPAWRNESIKAYGNAVVPQVVYQIFKAIQVYENQHLR